jgi:hypothetical protein
MNHQRFLVLHLGFVACVCVFLRERERERERVRGWGMRGECTVILTWRCMGECRQNVDDFG